MTLIDYLLEQCMLNISLAKSEIVNTAQKEKLTQCQETIRGIMIDRKIA